MKTSRNALLLLSSQFISDIGNWIDRIALLTLVYNTSKSTVKMSILSIIMLIPAVLFSVPFGRIIDISNKKRILLFGDFLRAILVFLIPFSVKYIFLLVFIISALTALYENTRSSLIPEIFKREELRQINSLSSSLSSLMMIIGPTIGGVLTASFNLKYCFYIDSFSFLISTMLISQISYCKSKNVEVANTTLRYKEFINFLNRNLIIKNVIAINCLTNLFAGILNGLLIVYVINYLHSNSKGYGLILTSKGIAMVITSFCLYKSFKDVRNEIIFLIGLIGLGISIMLFSLNSIFMVALFLHFINGIFNSLNAISRTTLIQQNCEKIFLGRCFSLNSMLSNIFSIVSLLIGGILSKFLSVRIVFLSCGFFITVTGILYLFKFLKVGFLGNSHSPS
ncbi:major facilitator superfamily MFS_1 [Caldicellulosiruptor acetigenus I77R1B]|uniref:Major facilitator superfamily MFS_1 n=1 Tax=Caldicellulosiruptor acetigenus (strain ATCC 700853 / DSM 12137 / I77R1B) TaxID=632335 RepID=E4SAT7_CALA7|nr:MFS transporter [Caldicellulosiruptor acetigenus]ADQ41258.1 major facilitator superfamily MFS_1 [Caldicellulosiruptor acetigenus I77R1B]WAM37152.1 MFS transporter [Caldicellulosiruptor acetigenus]